MDRTLWKQHLALAERHVVQAERHIAHQKQILAELARDGHSTAMASQLLATYESLLKMHVQDRDRLRHDLETDASGRSA